MPAHRTSFEAEAAFEAWLDSCPLPASALQEYTLSSTRDGLVVRTEWFLPKKSASAPSAAAAPSTDAAPPAADTATIAAVQSAISAAAINPPPAAVGDSAQTLERVKAALAAQPEAAAPAPAPMAPSFADEPNGERGVHGAHLPLYRWAQTMDEVGITLRVPPGTRGKALAVEIKRSRVTVALRGTSPPLLDAPLLCPVRPDNCSWTIEGGESLQLLLEKEASGQFWRCVSDGHPEVALPSWWPIAV